MKTKKEQYLNQYIYKFLNDFVFLDCRLNDHPKIHVSYAFFSEDFPITLLSHLINPSLIDQIRNLLTHRFANYYCKNELGYGFSHNIINDFRLEIIKDSQGNYINIIYNYIKSLMLIPLYDGNNKLGLLLFDSREKEYFNKKHLGLAQLLAALISYLLIKYKTNMTHITPSSIALGRALKSIREEIGLTQTNLAEKLNKNRITISRWEAGAQPPGIGILDEWCTALGLLSSNTGALVRIVDVTPNLLNMLREDPERLKDLSPTQFEQFIAERIENMGFDVALTGATAHKDGGIDLIAVPKVRTVGAFLLAAQIKHHSGPQKVGREAVDRLLAWKDSPFRLGLLVTNTRFTKDAHWLANQEANKVFLRLRDFDDLKRWIEENFWSKKDWQEIPDKIMLAPGTIIDIPRPKLFNSLDIWPLSEIDMGRINL